MGSLVVDVERGAGRLFKKLEEQPEIEAAVYQVFNEEVHEDLRGWTGAASATTTISQPDALDDATAAAAAAGKEAKAAGRRDFRVAVIGGGCSGLISAIKLRQAGIDFVVAERLPRHSTTGAQTGQGGGARMRHGPPSLSWD
jgi:heterodisulfide reductase subunit A-like polyferredoxin